MSDFRILYFDCDLDHEADIQDVSRRLGIEIVFSVLGKGVGRNLKNRWRPIPLVGDVYDTVNDEQQEKQLEHLIRKFSPRLLWVRSLTTNPEIVMGLSRKYGIPTVAWCTEQGASREGMSAAVRGFPNVIVNNVGDIEYYSRHHERVFYMPYCANTSFYKRVPAENQFRADVGSYGNPYYNLSRTELGMEGEKKFSVDVLIKPVVDGGYSLKLWGNSGGRTQERGWLQIPYIAGNPFTKLMTRFPVESRYGWAIAKRVRLVRSFYESRFARKGSVYQGPFEWQDYAAVNSSLKIFANIDHNFRFYRTYSPKLVRAMACGTTVLHMHTNGIEEDFQNHKHLIWTDGYEDTRELLKYYLEDRNENKLEEIGRNAMRIVTEKYNLSKWLVRILQEIRNSLRID